MEKLNLLIALILGLTATLHAAIHEIGPNKMYVEIEDFPWEDLVAGDTVYIYSRQDDYRAKWVLNAEGTAANPIAIIGVPGGNGELPTINGNNAVTRQELDYWNETRSVIKIGGSSVPADGMPKHIIIENLEIRSGYMDYSFTDDSGNNMSYDNNAASVFIEKGENITIRACTITDSGNGIFIADQSSDILIEKNYIHGNGVTGRFLEHNTYTEATNITYQFNRFGPLRQGADGNNLKDRSAGLVVRYNFIEGGNRLLDLVDSNNPEIVNNPEYNSTFVYGNLLVEEDGGNNQVLHYGGDSGNTGNYRKGKIYFYNNTLYSIRAGNTTLLRLSTNSESADVRNNILMVQAGGERFAFLAESGIMDISHNLLKPDWVTSHNGGFNGTLNDDMTSIETTNPEFVDIQTYDFHLTQESPAVNEGTDLHPDVLPEYSIDSSYVYHQNGMERSQENELDIGAYEYSNMLPATYAYLLRSQALENSVILDWATISEQNISHFILEHSSDLVRWNEIYSVSAFNNQSFNSYRYIHKKPESGLNYYRLGEISADGMKTHISISSAYISVSEIKIYPTFTKNMLYFTGLEDDKNLDVIIYNSSAYVVKMCPVQNGRISLSQLPDGMYYIHIREIGFVKKVMKY